MKITFIPLIFIEAAVFKKGSPLVWLQEWRVILSLIVLAAALELIAGCLLRISRTCWEVCRKPRFRELSLVVICTGIASGLWGIEIWYYSYTHSSHFRLDFSQTRMIVANVPDYLGASASHPTTAVIFSNLRLTNKYFPAIPTKWKLKVEFASGDELVGAPSPKNIVADRTYGRDEFVSSQQFVEEIKRLGGGLGNSNTIGAPAAFIFEGVLETTLLSPDATFVIEFDGLHETVDTLVPSHLRTAAP